GGKTLGIPGRVYPASDAEVSRCIRFSGGGCALACRPNITVRALEVFVLEALIRPAADGGVVGRGGGSQAILSQGGPQGFTLYMEGR
ncbi:unnamed protein product, partial [Discosporangium mesarthrocarpum]